MFVSAQILCAGKSNKEKAETHCGDSGPWVCSSYLCGVVSSGNNH